MYASFGLVERDFEVQRTIKSLLLFACVVCVLQIAKAGADGWSWLAKPNCPKDIRNPLSDVTVRKMVDICDGGHGTGKFTRELVLLHWNGKSPVCMLFILQCRKYLKGYFCTANSKELRIHPPDNKLIPRTELSKDLHPHKTNASNDLSWLNAWLFPVMLLLES